jgi:beta-glucosidase
VLKNEDNDVLPLRRPTTAQRVRLYTLGFNEAAVGDARFGGYAVVAGDRSAPAQNGRTPVPEDTDYAIIRIEVTNPAGVTGTYRSDDAATGGRINSSTRRAWGADDPDGLDNGLRFGGAFPWEADLLDFSGMATAESWQIVPSLPEIRATMSEIQDAKRVILCIYFRQPYVLDDASELKNAGGIVATFGVSDDALMDVLTGRFKPQGKLPFALANKPEAITRQDSDAPGYAAADTLYPFGFGLTY